MQDNVSSAFQTKCKSCGGITNYSPESGNLRCKYCGAEEELDKTPAELIENDYLEWEQRLNDGSSEQTDVMTSATEVKCQQCGATTTLEPDTSASNCAFCGTPLILETSEVKRFWHPEYVLPFQISEKVCRSNFGKWLKGKWFIPSALKKAGATPDKFKGVYLPFWTYDANTFTDYRGERGETREETRGSGNDKEKRTVTDWYEVNGVVDVAFNDIVIPASDSLSPNLASPLSRYWDMQNSVAYRPEFLSGFITELYKEDFVACLPKAKIVMKETIESDIREQIGGDKQKIHSMDIDYSDIKFKHLLMPVWISSFKYGGKVYQFVVNGRTGHVVGRYPKSTAKILAFVAAIIAMIAMFWVYFTR